MGNIRVLKNVVLEIQTEDNNVQQIIFRFGEIYKALKIIEDASKEYADVYLPTGVLRGISTSLYANYGVPVTQAEPESPPVQQEALEIVSPTSAEDTAPPVLLEEKAASAKPRTNTRATVKRPK